MKTELTTLPNGLRIVTEKMPGLASAAVGLWVTAGGRHERPDQNGIAHFLEHMAFKGTKRRSALMIAEEIEDVGGYINAYTSREMTAYYARVLEADVPLALDVIADIVLNPLFDEKEIEVERHVILQEIGQALDTPDDIIFDWLQEAAYPDQAMGRTILGPAECVSSFGRSDLRKFVSDHYGPERMILSAAGAVDLRVADENRVAADGHGGAELIGERAVTGDQSLPLHPARAVVDEDVRGPLQGVRADAFAPGADHCHGALHCDGGETETRRLGLRIVAQHAPVRRGLLFQLVQLPVTLRLMQ